MFWQKHCSTMFWTMFWKSLNIREKPHSTITLWPLSLTQWNFTWWQWHLTSLSSQCDCTYAQAHKLQKHKMTHTGEKAHKCYHSFTCIYNCIKNSRLTNSTSATTFALDWVANIHTHTLRHTEVRPYNCDQCIKAFTGKSCHTKHSSPQAQLYEHKEAHF